MTFLDPNQPASLKHPRPACPLKGWASAWAILDRIDNRAQREVLTTLIRNLGVQGGPALSYATRLAVHGAGVNGDVQLSPPEKLRSADIAWIQARVDAELATLTKDKRLFPRARR